MRYGKPFFLLVALLGLGVVVGGPLFRTPSGKAQGKLPALTQPANAPHSLSSVSMERQPKPQLQAFAGPLVNDDGVAEFPGAKVLAEAIEPNPTGGFERRRFLQDQGPYPKVRVIESYSPGKNGEFLRTNIVAMLADSILVSRPKETTPDQFAMELAALGLRAGPQYQFSPAVRVFVPEPIDLDTVAVVLSRLKVECPALVAEPNILQFTKTVPNDYNGGQLWGLERVGAPVAWSVSTGSSSLIAATIDSGIELQHPDLVANLWRNPGETTNGKDDDGNGLVDDLNGWDFADNDNNPSDVQGHGTHVAGIIGARGDNAVGVTGVAWQVKLLALRCGDITLSTSTVIQALDYLTDLKSRGAPIVVVNNSYGSTSSISTQRDSIVRAKQEGILFVAAAGNDGRDIDQGTHTYPVGYSVDNIVGVAASNLSDGLADYSNWGEGSVLLAAPGSGIWSTVLAGKYEVKEGTSMAAPMVTGAVILLKAAQPELDYVGIRQRLLTKVAPVAALEGQVASGGRLDLGRLIAPTVAVPRVNWETPLAPVVGVAGPESSLALTVKAVKELEGTAAGEIPVFWDKVFGPGSVSFQAGATMGSVIANFSLPGLYQIRATATIGSLSAAVERTVTVGLATVSPEALLARWTFDETSGPALDSSGNGRTATLVNGPTRDSGPLGHAALRFNGATTAASFDSPTPTKVTVAGWMYMDSRGNSVFPRLLHFPTYYLFPGRDAAVSPMAPDANRGTVKFLAHWSEVDGVYHTKSDLLANGRWYHMAATYDGAQSAQGIPRLFLDGKQMEVATQAGAAGAFAPTTGTGYMGNNADNTRALNGRLADVRIYGRELQPAEIALLAAEPSLASILAWELVVVSSESKSAVVQLRKSDGRIPSESQEVLWRRIEGPGTATFSHAADGHVEVTVPVQGNYTITVGLAEGQVSMEREFAVVLPGVPVAPVPPGFVSQPVGRTLAVGEPLTIEVEASGSPPLSYQWLREGLPLAGATGAKLVLPSAQRSDTGRYSVRVSNNGGDATSQEIEMIVLDPPAIVKHPLSRTIATGSRLELAVEAAGSPPLAYQWRRNEVPIAGATAATLVIDKVSTDHAGTYVVEVRNLVGTVDSDAAAVEVLIPPSIVTQTRSQTVASGSTVTLEATAAGSVPWSFQWLKNNQPIAGATSPSLRFLIAKATDSGDYRLRVSNLVGAALTDVIELRILDRPAITQQPRTQAAPQGARLILEVVASGAPTLKYQWYRGTSILNGKTGAQLIIESLQPDDVDSYTVKVSNEVGSVTSALAYVNIVSPPRLLRSPEGGAVAPGATLTLEVTPEGSSTSFSIRWLKDGKVVTAASGPQLQLGNVQPEQAGLYVAEVSSSNGSTMSLPAIVGVLPLGRTAGTVETRPEWQDIHHPNGNVYDQFLLTGTAGTFTADPGQIARLSFLDEDSDIVQVELSGSGAVTVCLTGASGPTAPVLYNQTGITYFQGSATVVLAGADASTHLSLYSVGRLNNPGVARADVPYDGWADVRALGVLSAEGSLGGLYLGNTTFSADAGPTGLVAPSVRSVGTVIFHQLTASLEGWPLLWFAAQGQVRLTIAGGDLAQTNNRAIAVSGLAAVTLGAGQGSSGQEAPVQSLQGRLVRDGVDVTAVLTATTSPQ